MALWQREIEIGLAAQKAGDDILVQVGVREEFDPQR